jgi:hypothetical protein
MNLKRYMILGMIGGAIVFAGNVIGVLWYNLWWAWGRTPMPPLTRFIVPRRMVGYHTIRFEMIAWSTCVMGVIAWLIWKALKSRTAGWSRTGDPLRGSPSGQP